mmetsp:Transcript_10672/g.26382  ORF Transcript_10672/g.26382 Transcript_10672/m.26382 type:complete len:181 (-) Transcript_10672:80-622(-)
MFSRIPSVSDASPTSNRSLVRILFYGAVLACGVYLKILMESSGIIPKSGSLASFLRPPSLHTPPPMSTSMALRIPKTKLRACTRHTALTRILNSINLPQHPPTTAPILFPWRVLAFLKKQHLELSKGKSHNNTRLPCHTNQDGKTQQRGAGSVRSNCINNKTFEILGPRHAQLPIRSILR